MLNNPNPAPEINLANRIFKILSIPVRTFSCAMRGGSGTTPVRVVIQNPEEGASGTTPYD